MKAWLVLISVQALWTSYLTGCVAQFTDTGTCPAEQNEDWSYRGNNGPRNWKVKYPLCDGRQQSPINIKTRNVVQDPKLDKLKLRNYDIPLKSATIYNNGHTIHVEPTDDVVRSIHIEQKEYRLSQFHFHWGDGRSRGSEHTINRNQYANELHLVHVSGDGDIAVVGVIFKEVLVNNPDMDPLIKSLQSAEFKGDNTNLASALNLERLVPDNPMSYYRYSGSLTTPACSENVIWSLAKRRVSIGRSQMKEFRKLKAVSKADFDSSNGKCKLVNNYRPVQPRNGRTIYTSL